MFEKKANHHSIWLLGSLGIMLGCASHALAADPWQIERLNINPDLNASTPAMASDGTNVYAAWVEEAGPTTGTARRVRVKKNDGNSSVWTQMGTTASLTTSNGHADKPDIVCTDSSIWVASQQFGVAGDLTKSRIVVDRWNGTDWQNAAIFYIDDNQNCDNVSLAHYQDMVYVAWYEGGLPHVRRYNGSVWENFGETEDSARNPDIVVDPLTGIPYTTHLKYGSQVVVRKYDGAAWVQLGSGVLTYAGESPTIDHDGTSLCVFFIDKYRSQNGKSFFWDGSSWVQAGGSVNSNSITDYGTMIKLHHGIPYVIYSGGSPSANYLKYYNGSNWVAVGDPLVFDSQQSASNPGLVFRGESPFMVWQEPRASDSRTHVYVAHSPLPTSTSWVGTSGQVIAFPNPAKERATFAYAVEKASKVVISIYNLNGQLVGRIIDEYSSPNPVGRSLWELKDVARGVYLCRFVMEPADGSAKTEKMLKLSVVK